ncbi:leucine repeat adapter protein 25-like [Haliotis rufescens]|uniref:leucine repeat adapter protein 25-like n=1 Tax=Haliotis rufescens TaxID=6454 RepID=UPI001EAFB17A|nr:leucine repeat adapter protein 25-like [Haliotis rufescens]
MSEDNDPQSTMSQIPGLPPLPRCFSGLLGSDSSQWRETEKMHTLKANLLEELAQESLCESDQGDSGTPPTSNGVNGEVESPSSTPHPVSSFSRLNASLTTLRREMVDLRQLDMSLLCQLWSLHEAIQEYKVVMQDRYSETNSECSFGTGMSSRVGSFSSLNDDSDWNDQDYHMQPEPDYHLANSIHSSTSSLLQQINQLKERVDAEF